MAVSDTPHVSWTSHTDTLGLKALPILEELRDEGIITSFDEEHRLDRLTGHAYRADYYLTLPNGAHIDVEVDYTAQHSAQADFRRDQNLAASGISTVRINQIEINEGTAKDKIVHAIEAVQATGAVLKPGSTRVRRKKPISPVNYGLDSYGLYIAVSGQGDLYTSTVLLKSLRWEKGNQVPDTTRFRLDRPLHLALPSKEAVIAATLTHPDVLPHLPFCNLTVYVTYAQNSYVLKRRLAKSDDGIEKLALDVLAKFNLIYLFTVSSKSYQHAQGNFGVLGTLMHEPRGVRHAYNLMKLKYQDASEEELALLALSTATYMDSCITQGRALIDRPHFLSVPHHQLEEFRAANERLPQPCRARFDEKTSLWYLPESLDPKPFTPWDKTTCWLKA